MPIPVPTHKVSWGGLVATSASAAQTQAAAPRQYAVVVGAAGHASADPAIITISNSGTALTWTQIADRIYSTGANPRLRIMAWIADISTGLSAQTVTVASSGAASVAGQMSIWQDINTASFTNVAYADNAAGDPSITLAAVGSDSAVLYGAYGVGGAAFTFPTGYTELADALAGTARQLTTGYDVASPATSLAIVSTNTYTTAFAIEFKANQYNQIVTAGQTRIGDMTTSGGLGAAFDGTTNSLASVCAAKNLSTGVTAHCGTRLASATRIDRVFIHGSNDQGFCGVANPSISLWVYGKNGSDPANNTDGTLLGPVLTFTDTSNESAGRSILCGDAGTYDRVWVTGSHQAPTTPRNLIYAEIILGEIAVGGPATGDLAVTEGGPDLSLISDLRLVDTEGQTRIGDMTGQAGLESVFDGVIDVLSTNTAAKSFADTGSGYVGTRLARSWRIDKAIVYGGNNLGYVAAANPQVTFSCYGKNGSNPANATDGTLLGTLAAFTDVNDATGGRIISCTDTGHYDRVWVVMTHSATSSQACGIGELQLYEAIAQSALDATEEGEDSAAIEGTVETGGLPDITGSLGVTEIGADTAEIDVFVDVAGSLAATEAGSDSAALDVDVKVTGTLQGAEVGSDTAAAAGAVAIAGMLAVSEVGADAAAATGTVAVAGNLLVTEVGSDSGLVVGVSTISGSISAAEVGADTAAIVASTGALAAINGSLAVTETGSDTASGTGLVAVAGTLAAAEVGPDLASISGTVRVTGSLSRQETGSDTAASAATVRVSGTVAATEVGADTASVAGTVTVTGASTAQEVGSDTAAITGALVVPTDIAALSLSLVGLGLSPGNRAQPTYGLGM